MIRPLQMHELRLRNQRQNVHDVDAQASGPLGYQPVFPKSLIPGMRTVLTFTTSPALTA